ncbi:MAG TPA: M28 family peptidase [Pyrinomonadaceae bacterium]|nr:M28 family peptidase [Pyrinomonadaceae bacterium]
MAHARKQVEFGPRPPGSPELARTRDYIVNELRSYGLQVTTDEFTAKTPKGDKRMVNITAEVPGESSDVIILSSHYETKFYEDMIFVGANDPAASAGTLLELGRVLASSNEKPKYTYWLVFFDGEEALCEGWDDCGTPEEPDNTYGSRHYVSELRKRNELNRIGAMILLDLIGYKNLELRRDTMSTKWLVDTIWQTGRELGYGDIFLNESEDVGGDDHLPFLRAGIDAVDIIQLISYPYWHRADDTLDKISPRSMKIVGDVVLSSLPKIEQRLSK